MQPNQWPKPRLENERFAQLSPASPWFEIRAVNERTFAILEPRHYEEVISYLILGDDRAVLLDTGMGVADMCAEIDRLTSLPVTVVASHRHFDHVGGLHQFDDVWVFDDDTAVAQIERGCTPAECAWIFEPHLYTEPPPGFDPADYQIRPARVTRRLRHGDTIDLGGRVLEIFHTPGHCADEIVVLDSPYGLLFTGDMFYPGALYADNPDSDLEAYARSAALLVGLLPRVQGICPAHNLVWQPPEMLPKLETALRQILSGSLQSEPVDEETIGYEFGDFRVYLPRPLPSG